MYYLRFTILLLFICFFSSNNFSQNLEKTNLNKLSGLLWELVQDHKKNTLSKVKPIQPSGTSEGEEVYSVIITSDNINEVKSLGINVNSEVNDFVTARVTIDELLKLIDLNSVKKIETGEILFPHNDLAGALVGAELLHSGYVNNTIYKGQGVLTCIIDSGIDWDHPDFRDSADQTQSRILYLWDQTLTKTGAEQTPQERDGTNFFGLNYGVEYTKAHIDDELDGSAPGFVRETDIVGHGTHVAGTATGNGAALSDYKYAGIAPKADIIVVKAGNGSFSSTNVIDALTYARRISIQLGRPMVVNLSLGGHQNAHDGTSSQDQAVNNFVGAGRIAVVSAGNSGASSIHITGTVASLDTADITFTVPSYTANSGSANDFFAFDQWFDTNGDVTARLITPNSILFSMPAGFQQAVTSADGGMYLFNFVDPDNGDRHVLAQVYDPLGTDTPVPGTWTLSVINNSAGSMVYHGWLYNTSFGATLNGGNTQYTVAAPGTASEAITVCSYVPRWRWRTADGSNANYAGTDFSDNISSFSSIGPRRDGVQKPDITAPGQAIISATSSNTTPAINTANVIVTGSYHVNQGTSMSAPVVTGAAALLLEQNSTLTASQVKTYLTDNADIDSYTGAVPNASWGYGKLNIFAGMIDLVNSSWSASREVLAYDEWLSHNSVGILPNEKIAVKFTPGFSGKITGLLFHLFGVSNISGTLSAEIWSDNGSNLPNAQIGSTVLFPAQNILGNSWNYINLQSADVNVTSGINYHAVLYFTSGSMSMFGVDIDNVDARSSINSSGSWAASSAGDFRIRTINTTSDAFLPVELVAFNASASGSSVKLNWQTATEVNNYGFEVERLSPNPSQREGSYEATLRGVWKAIGFLNGAGNSNSLKEYSFIDEKPLNGKTLYRLKQIDSDGKFSYSEEVEVLSLPLEYALEQNYPNPFNPVTNFGFRISGDGLVNLKIYDILGNEVTTLVNEKKEPGAYEVKFDGSNLSSGVYLYKLTAQNAAGGTAFTSSKKFILLK